VRGMPLPFFTAAPTPPRPFHLSLRNATNTLPMGLSLLLLACPYPNTHKQHQTPSTAPADRGALTSRIRPSTDPKTANFTLIAMNSSRRLRNIDFEVYIDDVLVVRDQLENQHPSEDGIQVSDPRTQQYDFQLPAGKHHLHAVTRTGGAELDWTFNGTARHQWALIGYEREAAFAPAKTKTFSFEIGDQPILFE